MHIKSGRSYKKGELPEKIEFWIDYWSVCINDFHPDFHKFGITQTNFFANPHYILINLVEDLAKAPNFYKDFYLRFLGNLKNRDIIIKKEFSIEFGFLCELIHNNNLDYLNYLGKKILLEFQNGKYFRELCIELSKILLEKGFSDKDKSDIDNLTSLIIQELFLKGYEFTTIENIPNSLFDKYEYYDDKNHLITSFPHSININDYYLGSSIDYTKYEQAIKNKIDSLTIEDRLKSLQDYWSASDENLIYIFNIEGLKGDYDRFIGNVNFYSPNIKQYIDGKKIENQDVLDQEFFGLKDKGSCINAAVEIHASKNFAGNQIAANEVNKALDFLRLKISSDVPFDFNPQHFLYIKDGIFGGGSLSINKTDPWYKKHYSIDLDDYYFGDEEDTSRFETGLQTLFEDSAKNLELPRKIIDSLHFYGKARESKHGEDKLVNYWIAIENITNFSKEGNKDKISKIIDYLTPFLFFNYIQIVGLDLLIFLRNYARIYHNFEEENANIDEFIKKLKLLEVEPPIIEIKEFIKNLESLELEFPDYLTSYKTSKILTFFFNTDSTNEHLKFHEMQVEFDIKMIYRLRNSIVHNAQNNMIFLPFYIKKARYYSQVMLIEFLNRFIKDRSITMDALLMDKKIDFDILIKKINLNQQLDLVNLVEQQLILR